MKLIVGLGNPGDKYRLTRHNIGANVAKAMARSNNISLRRKKFLSFYGEGRIAGHEVNIILPMTYMNRSGEAVSAIVGPKEIALSEILVLCDDADLQLGRIRIRPKGSDGGHRGLRSIIENLGSESFARLRIGIGRDEDLKGHVLRPFGKGESKKVEAVEGLAVEAAECWMTKGMTKAMNEYNSIAIDFAV